MGHVQQLIQSSLGDLFASSPIEKSSQDGDFSENKTRMIKIFQISGLCSDEVSNQNDGFRSALSSGGNLGYQTRA